MMQKNLKLKSIKDAQRNYLWFSVLFLGMNFFFLCLGFLFYVFMDTHSLPIPAKTDVLYPFISENYLGMMGVVCFVLGMISATFSSCASSLIALTSSFWLDIMPAQPSDTTVRKKQQRRTHSVITVLFLIGTLIFYHIDNRSVVVAIFKIAGYTYGPLLGIFCVGILSKLKVTDRWVPYIAITSVIITALVDTFSERLFFGYRFGFEILLLNAFVTIVWLVVNGWLGRKKSLDCSTDAI